MQGLQLEVPVAHRPERVHRQAASDVPWGAARRRPVPILGSELVLEEEKREGI